jgi:hypothetical protein
MHIFVEAEMLAVERDRSVDIVDDVADLNRGHSVFLLSSLNHETSVLKITYDLQAVKCLQKINGKQTHSPSRNRASPALDDGA